MLQFVATPTAERDVLEQHAAPHDVHATQTDARDSPTQYIMTRDQARYRYPAKRIWMPGLQVLIGHFVWRDRWPIRPPAGKHVARSPSVLGLMVCSGGIVKVGALLRRARVAAGRHRGQLPGQTFDAKLARQGPG